MHALTRALAGTYFGKSNHMGDPSIKRRSYGGQINWNRNRGNGKIGYTQTDRLTGAVLDVFSLKAATLEREGRKNNSRFGSAQGGSGNNPPTQPRQTETAERSSELSGRSEVGVRSDLLGDMGKTGHVG